MITPEGIQRILDYHIFRHNFGKFHEYQEVLQTSYEEFIIILTEIPNKRKMTGHHHSFKSEFRKLRIKLKHLIKSEILQGSSSKMKRRRDLVYSKIPELKRRSFRDMVEEITSPDHISLPLSDDELELFVRSRNSLVHKGDLYCNTANNRDRVTCPPKQTPADEYFFLTNILDRMFLKILGYQGIYIDCSHDFDRVMLP